MIETVKYLLTKIEYEAVHPLMSKYWGDSFDLFLPKLWSKSTVMFHIGRSGSTVLGNLLGQTKEIFWDDEIYLPFFEYLQYKRKENKKFKKDQVSIDLIKVLRDRMLLQKSLHLNKSIYGCEIQFNHLRRIQVSLEAYIDYLKNLGFKHFIILERKNYLRSIVSTRISILRLKKYHISSNKKPQLSQIRLDVNKVFNNSHNETLIQLLQKHHNDFQNIENLLHGSRVLKLTYEDDIVKDPNNGVGKACQFLEIEHQKGKIQYGKTNPFPLNEIIDNYEEVEKALQGTSFEWMLYD